MSENEIQNSILEFLRFKKIMAWRNNSGAVYDKSNECYRRKSKYDINGVSDILAILPDGRFLAIEVKRNKRSRASEDQRKFIRKIRKNGGVAFVAWSIEMVSSKLNKYM